MPVRDLRSAHAHEVRGIVQAVIEKTLGEPVYVFAVTPRANGQHALRAEVGPPGDATTTIGGIPPVDAITLYSGRSYIAWAGPWAIVGRTATPVRAEVDLHELLRFSTSTTCPRRRPSSSWPSST